MKKLKTKPQQPKPLVLTTETVRTLADEQLEGVQGGGACVCCKSYDARKI